MKRFVCLLAALLVVMALPVTVFAQEELKTSDVTVKPGETVYITVSLAVPVEGTTLGVSSSYDTTLLEAVPSDSEWKVEGLLSDFNEKGMGVWTTDKTVKLEGDVVVLAFRGLSDQAFATEVVCTLIVKDGSDEVGRYTATAKVTQEATRTGETRPVETTAAEPEKTLPTVAAEGATQPTGTMPSVGATETVVHTPPTLVGADQTNEPQNSGWLLWLLGLVIVGAAVAAVVILRKKKTQA